MKAGLAPTSGTRRLVELAPGACLALAVVLLYWEATRFGYFIVDDYAYTADNPLVRRGLSAGTVWEAFRAPLQSYWIPLTWVSYLLDVACFGLSPGTFHRTNVVLFGGNAFLLYGFLLSATGSRWKSLAAAALFAFHPFRVESVAWIAERKDLLSGLFFLVSLLAYVRYTRTGKSGWYGAVLAALGLGLLAKPSVVVLPALLLLLDYWPLGRLPFSPGGAKPGSPGFARVLGEKVPPLVFSLLIGAATLSTQATERTTAVGVGARLAGALTGSVRYLGGVLWPDGPAFEYAAFAKPVDAAEVAVAVGVIAALSWAAWRWRESAPYLTVGWCWFLLSLAPVSGLIRVGKQVAADRFTYLASMGVAVTIVWGCAALLARLPDVRARGGAGLVLAGFPVLALAAATSRQLPLWESTYTFCAGLQQREGSSALAHCLAGSAHLREGRPEAAFWEYSRAVALAPGYAEGLAGLGRACTATGRLAEAPGWFEQAICLEPATGRHYADLGDAYASAGRPAEAAAAYEAALAVNTGEADYHYRLGVAYAALDRKPAAVRELEEALRLRPYFETAHFNLAVLFGQLGRPDLAERHYREELGLRPGHAPSLCGLGELLAARGAWEEAERSLRRALLVSATGETGARARQDLRELAALRGERTAPAGGVP